MAADEDEAVVAEEEAGLTRASQAIEVEGPSEVEEEQAEVGDEEAKQQTQTPLPNVPMTEVLRKRGLRRSEFGTRLTRSWASGGGKEEPREGRRTRERGGWSICIR